MFDFFKKSLDEKEASEVISCMMMIPVRKTKIQILIAFVQI
jgi:hypothetical protein